MLNILLTNDDGILAPGLLILREQLKAFANVVVIAPETDSSGCGSSISLSSVLRIRQLEKDVFALRGTPADCVHAALTGLLPAHPDIVISGINNRSNLGDDIIYSGTFGAAYEGRRLKYPALAISMASTHAEPCYQTGARVCQKVLEIFHYQAYYHQGVVNINVPDIDYQELRGFKVTQLGQRPYSHEIVREQDPRGNDYFWLGARKEPENDLDPCTDFYAIAHHQVSMTPICLNLGDQNMMVELDKFFN